MKVLERASTPTGVKIQVEDWREDYPTVCNAISLAAYPTCQNYVNEGYFFPKPGERFRFDTFGRWASNEEVWQAFEGLRTGVRSLKEFEDHLWDPKYKGLI